MSHKSYTPDQKAVYKFAQELGRAVIRNNICRQHIRRVVAAQRISEIKHDTSTTPETELSIKLLDGNSAIQR